jgi:threonine synthase
MRQAVAAEGIPICPEAAACVLAAEQLLSQGWLKRDERVVLFNTGAAQKYLEAIQTDLPRLDKNQPIDWQRWASMVV